MFEISGYPLLTQLLLGSILLVLVATVVIFALGFVLEFVDRAKDFLNIGSPKVCMNCVYWDTGIDDRSKTTSVGYCRFNAPSYGETNKKPLEVFNERYDFSIKPVRTLHFDWCGQFKRYRGKTFGGG